MKYSNLIRVIGILLFAISCGKDNNEEPVVPDPIVVPVENTRNDSFVGPAYADNYTPIATGQQGISGIWPMFMILQSKSVASIITWFKPMLPTEMLTRVMVITHTGARRIW